MQSQVFLAQANIMLAVWPEEMQLSIQYKHKVMQSVVVASHQTYILEYSIL